MVIRSANAENFRFAAGEIRTQAAFDRQLQYVIDSGLDYIAFLDGTREHPGHGWARFFFGSRRRGRVTFCVMGGVKQFDWGETLTQRRRRWVRYMGMPNYLQTPDGRPIIYLQKPTANGIAELRRIAQAAGLKNPYVVQNQGALAAAGGDARCSYGGRIGGYLHPGFDLSAYDRMQTPVVPHYDVRMTTLPRDEIDYPHHDDLYRNGRLWRIPAEKGPDRNVSIDWFGNELHKAIQWTAANPERVPAQVVIMYCWDEHAEGGLFSPSRGWKTGYVKKIADIQAGAAPVPVLEAHWTFNDDVRDHAAAAEPFGHDTAGKHHGRIRGAPAYVEGRRGQALRFTSDKHDVEVKDDLLIETYGKDGYQHQYEDTNLDCMAAFSIAAWVRLDKLPAGKHSAMIWDKPGSHRCAVTATDEIGRAHV